MSIDHEWTRDPVCPHCGHKVRDAWELGFGGSAEGTEEDFECGNCEGIFDIERTITVSYTTVKKDGGR
jgi:hypothetical protein